MIEFNPEEIQFLKELIREKLEYHKERDKVVRDVSIKAMQRTTDEIRLIHFIRKKLEMV